MLWVTAVIKNIQSRAPLQICPLRSLNAKECKSHVTLWRSLPVLLCSLLVSARKEQSQKVDWIYRRSPLGSSFSFCTSDHKWDRAFGSNLGLNWSPTAQNQHSWLVVSKCFCPVTVTVPQNWIYLYQKDGGQHYRMAKAITKLEKSSRLKLTSIWTNHFHTLVIWPI